MSLSLQSPSYSSAIAANWINSALAPLINISDYKLYYSLSNNQPSANSTAKISAIHALAKRLFFSDLQIKELEATKSLTLHICKRLHRLYEFAEIMSRFQEDGFGVLSIKNSRTVTHLTSFKLMRLFEELFKMEFLEKENKYFYSGEGIQVDDLFFFVKAEDKRIHIVLQRPFRLIGKGSCGYVAEVFNVALGRFEALKYVSNDLVTKKKTEQSLEKILLHEIEVIKRLNFHKRDNIQNSPGVVFDFRNKSNRICSLAYTTDIMDGNLSQFLEMQILDQKLRIDICHTIIEALEKNVWSQDFTHGDLCLENILFKCCDKKIYISIHDFGNAQKRDLPPPVCLRRRNYNSMFDSFEESIRWQTEIFQLGTTLYCILASIKEQNGPFFHRFPYPIDINERPMKNAQFNKNFLLALGYSGPLVSLIEDMVEQKPSNRCSREEFIKEWTLFRESESKVRQHNLVQRPMTSVVEFEDTAVRIRQNLNPQDFPNFLSIFPSKTPLSQPPLSTPFVNLLSHLKEHEGALAIIKNQQLIPIEITAHTLIHLIHKLLKINPQTKGVPSNPMVVNVDGLDFLVIGAPLHIICISNSKEISEDTYFETKEVIDLVTGSFLYFKNAVIGHSNLSIELLTREMKFLNHIQNKPVKHFQNHDVTSFDCRENFSNNERRMFGYFSESQGHHFMDYFDKLLEEKEISPAIRIFLCNKIIEPLIKVWMRSIRHLNISLENFFYKKTSPDDDFTFVITNFSQSNVNTFPFILEKYESCFCGTKDVEILQKAKAEKNLKRIYEIESKIDVYQLGTCIYQLLTNKISAYSSGSEQDEKMGHEFQGKTLIDLGYTKQLSDFIKRMVDNNLETRMTVSEFIDKWKNYFLYNSSVLK